MPKKIDFHFVIFSLVYCGIIIVLVESSLLYISMFTLGLNIQVYEIILKFQKLLYRDGLCKVGTC